MKRLVLLLLSLVPFYMVAQYNDIYFVPVKEKKGIVPSSARENSFVDIDNFSYNPEGCDVEEDYYDEDAYEYYDEDDYRYSTRIIRFRNPRRLVCSPIYWDLRYNCGMDDWLIYDDGYYLNVYPTYNNPAYYWSYSSWAFNDYWTWNAWHDPYCHWNSHYWGHHHGYPWHPGFSHAGHRPPHFANNSWRPAHKVHTDVPLNGNRGQNNRGTVVNNNSRGNANVVTNSSAKQERRPANSINRQQPVRNTNRVSAGNTEASRGSGTNVVRRQTTNRVAGGSQGSVSVNRQNPNRQPAVRRQQPVRQTNGTRVNNSSSRNEVRRSSGSNVRSSSGRSSSGGETKRRNGYSSSSSSSSRGYSRPSSTSVSRQSSSTSRSSSYSGGSSSRSSNSSSMSRSSSASRSGGRR